MNAFEKPMAEIISANESNITAFVKSGEIWRDGLKELSDAIVASAQAHIDRSKATWDAMQDVKSLKSAIELQTSATCASVESFSGDAVKISTASLKLYRDVMAPITAQTRVADQNQPVADSIDHSQPVVDVVEHNEPVADLVEHSQPVVDPVEHSESVTDTAEPSEPTAEVVAGNHLPDAAATSRVDDVDVARAGQAVEAATTFDGKDGTALPAANDHQREARKRVR